MKTLISTRHSPISMNMLYEKELDDIFSIINKPMSLNQSDLNARELIEKKAMTIIRIMDCIKI